MAAPKPGLNAALGFVLLSLVVPCLAHDHGRRPGHGLVGLGIPMYEPYCAFACRDVLAGCRLNCSSTGDEEHHHARRHPGHVARFETSAECRASGDAFLGSLAWCLHSHCGREETDFLDRFWRVDAVGSGPRQPVPKHGYLEALGEIGTPPTEVISHQEVLEGVRLVPEEDWQLRYGKLKATAQNEIQNTRFGLALILVSVLLPVVGTLIGFLLRSTPIEGRVLATLVHPALLGKRHLVPLPLEAGILPYRGQAAFISAIVVLNLVVSTTGYTTSIEGSSFEPTRTGKAELVANRIGILAFANLFVMILFCLRNNPLIRLTGWSHGTFLLYHRWVAYLCIFQAAAHGTIYWVLHVGVLDKKLRQGYWNAGLLTVLSLLVTVPLSALPVRRRVYEVFLDSHVGLALAVLVGLYCHIDWHFGHAWGYENWIYLAAAAWGLERLVRMVRVAKNGLRTATVSGIDDEYIEVTVPGVEATGHAFLYFPTLGWRVWENHPFSISSSVREVACLDFEGDLAGDASRFELVGSDSDSECEGGDVDEKQPAEGRFLDIPTQGRENPPPTPSTPPSGVALLTDEERDAYQHDDDGVPALSSGSSRLTPGLTFYIRRGEGMTARLARLAEGCGSTTATLPVLVETSYGTLPLARLATCAPRLVCVLGGAGVTAALPLLRARSGLAPARTAVYWGCRSAGLARRAGVQGLAGATMEVFVRVGGRWDVREVVRREAEGHGEEELVVVVSGPAQMADEARQAVVEANSGRARRGERGVVRLVEECFSW